MPRTVRPASAARHAFTLLEMMLVIAIIGVLMAVVAINVVGGGEKARIQATKASLRQVEIGLKQYHLDYGSYPPNLAALVDKKLIEKAPKDAWKRDIQYFATNAPGKPYTLYSLGADGEGGTEDDIDSTQIDE